MEEVAKCDVIKMSEMRGEKEKKWIITHFYDVTCFFFERLFPFTSIVSATMTKTV